MKTKSLLYINLRRIPQEQFESLLAGKRLGYHNIVFCRNPIDANCGLEGLIDETYQLDTTNLAELLSCVDKIKSKRKIAGVLAFTESGVEAASLLAEHLKLPGLPSVAIEVARNKYKMRCKLQGLKNVSPAYRKANLDELEEVCKTLNYPLIIKPINASGSTGIFKIMNFADIAHAKKWLAKIVPPRYDVHLNTKTIQLIIEEFIDGEEVSIDGLVQRGEIVFTGITDKWTTDEFSIEYQHVFPSCKPKEVQNMILATSNKIIKTLGFDNCAFHLEGKVQDGYFKFIEIAARPGGDLISSHLIPYSTGVAYYEQLIKVAVGEDIIKDYRPTIHAGIRFKLAEKEGIYEEIQGLDTLINFSLLRNFMVETSVKDVIELPPHSYRKIRLFGVVAVHQDYKKIIQILNHMMDMTKVGIK